MVSRPMTWDELVEVITHQNQEIAKLRKVVDAARIAVDNAGRVRVGQNPVYDLRQALAELDRKEG
jgi:hypothetical protein